MNCERELLFVQKLLDNFFLPFTILCLGFQFPTDAPWAGLRHLLHPRFDAAAFYDSLVQVCRPHVFYRYQDELGCCSLIFRLDGGPDPVFGAVGPYLLQPLTPDLLTQNAGKFPDPEAVCPSLERYYRETPYLPNENHLMVVLYTLADYLWEGQSATVQDFPARLPSLTSSILERDVPQPADSPLSMEALENRYADEERLIRAVSAGQTGQAAIAYSRFTARQMEQRAAPPLRDMKNYFVVFNTLLRKAAQYGHVHPLYIDQVSGTLAKEIEAAASTDVLSALGPKMVRHYCRLVQDFSMKGHSQLISQLLLHIEADLSADLSLSALAKQLSVNSSYLSTLFKKELGATLTEYVSKRRVNYAMLLLDTTSLQIQAIAQHCGIPDVNYFTRTFKKYAGMTPKEYRAGRRNG